VIYLLVFPAKAGTHTACRLIEALVVDASHIRSLVVMGPGSR
jgi:hypothetical protein